MSRLNDWFIRYNNLNLKYYKDTDDLLFYGEEYGCGTGDGYMDLGMVAWNIGLYTKIHLMLLIELVIVILIGVVILTDQMNLMNKIKDSL